MQYEKYKEFVINYKPFDWEIDLFDFRENIKGKHSFIINFVRLYKVSIFLEKLKQGNFIKEFLHTGGLRCEILSSGKIFIGDLIK